MSKTENNQKAPANSMLAKLQKLYSMNGVESKDLSLKKLFDEEATKGKLEIEVIGIGSKYVAKYDKPDTGCLGFHTMLYMRDGRKTGGFSNALHRFASFFFENLGLDPDASNNHIDLSGDDFIRVKITKVDLPDAKTTYDIEIIGGELTTEKFTIAGGTAAPFMLEAAQNVFDVDPATGEVIEN